MKLKIDTADDTLYFRFDESEIIDSEEIRPGMIVDYDANNNIIGIEILQVSRRIPSGQLKCLQFETG